MNKRQTEVEKAKLAAEAQELKHLKGIYNKAAEDIAKNISITDGKIEVMLQEWDSLSDDDKSVYRSKIYQKNFQKQLQSQINDILKDLNSGQYKSIDEYLKKCYETGYIGTMYDIAGQGIPIISPIDQKKVIRAMKTNSKISGGLYAKLGEDVDHLKKRIANNISRGIATSDSYENIARNIASASNVGMNNAMRVVRTEGHRIHSNSAHDAQLAAKDAGAAIVKMWDSTMDGNTRTTHRRLDGQIREVEEPFEMDGKEAMYPSDFGRPEEDINCRCALLQRATWALDEDELETLKEKAKFHEIYVENDSKETFRKQKDIDLNTFTQRYLKATTTPTKTAKKVASQATKTAVKSVTNSNNGGTIQLDVNNFSDAFTTKKAERENTQKLVDYVNSLQGANPTALKLFNSIGKLENYSANGIKFSISHGKNHAVRTSYRMTTGNISEVQLVIPKLSGTNLAGQVGTTLHEEMHLIDLMLRSDPTKYGEFFGASFTPLKDAVKNATSDIGADMQKLFADFHAEITTIRANATKAFNDAHDQLKAKYLPNGIWGAGADYKTYQKEYNKIKKTYDETVSYESRNALGGGIDALEDIYDALSGGRYRDTGVVKYGHGGKYYRWQGERINEIVANYGALSITRPDLVNMLRKDKPELVKALDEMLDEMVKKV